MAPHNLAANSDEGEGVGCQVARFAADFDNMSSYLLTPVEIRSAQQANGLHLDRTL